jgi:hypothetical protein
MRERDGPIWRVEEGMRRWILSLNGGGLPMAALEVEVVVD